VAAAGGTRSGLAREMEANGVLRAHTVRCLLGTPGTVIGKRKPTFDSILKVANAAGFDLILMERKHK
jgi:DNA-binding phage protein